MSTFEFSPQRTCADDVLAVLGTIIDSQMRLFLRKFHFLSARIGTRKPAAAEYKDLADFISMTVLYLNISQENERRKGIDSFIFIELFHHRYGEKTMRHIASKTGRGIFYSFGPRFDDTGRFARYFTALGLAKEMYLMEEDSLDSYPLYCICNKACSQPLWFDQLLKVPREIVEMGLELVDKRGNTMLHLLPFKNQHFDSTGTFASCIKSVIQYLSQFEGFERCLLTKNYKGRTPLHLLVLTTECFGEYVFSIEPSAGKKEYLDTLRILLDTPAGKKAAAMRDYKDRTPHFELTGWMYTEYCSLDIEPHDIEFLKVE